ncbi:hypothetical protein ASC89_26645 [Devosia sp. Root413D1]|nr:hypothetical protein ASC89_26645 [Devosia sp. Root413D1]
MDAATATGQTKPQSWGRGWRWAAPGEGALDWVRGRGPLTRLIGATERGATPLPTSPTRGEVPAGAWGTTVPGTGSATSPLVGEAGRGVAAGAGPADYLVLHIPCRGSFVMDVRR